MNTDATAPGEVVTQRRIERLSDELDDEQIRLPTYRASSRLLEEIVYARRAPHFEGHRPPYGALVFDGVPDWDESPLPPVLIPCTDIPPSTTRRFADGRSSFVVSTPDGIDSIAAFGQSFDDELGAVRVARTGATVVQAVERGTVRITGAGGVVIWTGAQWLSKPSADDLARLGSRLAPHADPSVLDGLMALALHTLAATGVGATLVWNLDDVAPTDRRGGLIELNRRNHGPPLSVARRSHFPAIRSGLAQRDLATVIAADGTVGPIGVRLGSGPHAAQLVPPMGGARHTSARRFSYEVPTVLIVVVSQAGRVTVLSGGGIAAEAAPAATSRELDGLVANANAPDRANTSCPVCRRRILVVNGNRRVQARCPVCDHTLQLRDDAVVLGVPVATNS